MNPNQNTEEEIVTSQVNHPVFQVTKTSKYLALLLFILMPFVGGWIGYNIVPSKIETKIVQVPSRETVVAEVPEGEMAEVQQSSDIIFHDAIVNHIKAIASPLEPDGLSSNQEYLSIVNPHKEQLELVYLPDNELIRIISTSTLPFLSSSYQQQLLRTLPSQTGHAVYVDFVDGCACDKKTEAIVHFVDDKAIILPLPSIAEFRWDGLNLNKFKYKEMIFDESVCANVDGMCVPVRPADDWTEGDLTLATNIANIWDGSSFDTDYRGRSLVD